jgi:mono/diheme cytochrome c family protein
MFTSTSVGWSVNSLPVVLPVDIATRADGLQIAVPSAGRTKASDFANTGGYFVFQTPTNGGPFLSPCGGPNPLPPLVGGAPDPVGRVVAVAFDPSGQLGLQTREPAAFFLGTRSVALPGRSRKHTGHELFHLATAGGLACASCHPEGHEDGHVWNFAKFGPRRTQSLAGGILGSEPFHWSGDMQDFAMLTSDVFVSRMSGPEVTPEHAASLKKWVNTIPRMEAPAPRDVAASERGRALFNDPEVGCATCHSGERLSNNTTVAVNTGNVGESFQVPSLRGVAWRAPYMHDGCAATMADRFGSCGGGDQHGRTSQLTDAQRADLVAYLDSL